MPTEKKGRINAGNPAAKGVQIMKSKIEVLLHKDAREKKPTENDSVTNTHLAVKSLR